MQLPFLRLAPAFAALALAACGGQEPAGGSAVQTAQANPGARLYMQNCIACHQRNGEGVPGVQPALAGTPVTIGDPAELAAWVMYNTRPASLPAGQYRGVMPQFAYLKDTELAELLTYVRTSFGNSASPVTPDLIAKVRAEHAK
jgi:mono/diheme cytochrome c family protein